MFYTKQYTGKLVSVYRTTLAATLNSPCDHFHQMQNLPLLGTYRTSGYFARTFDPIRREKRDICIMNTVGNMVQEGYQGLKMAEMAVFSVVSDR